jgi:hypothetical protein
MATQPIAINSSSYTKVNTTTGTILLEARNADIRYIIASTQPARSDKGHKLELGGTKTIENPTSDLWVRSVSNKTDAEVIVTESVQTTETSDRGSTGLSVFVQDQTTKLLDVPFLRERTSTTLAADTAIDDRTVLLTPGHGAVIGDVLEIAATGTEDFIQSKVLNVATNTITIDQPINRIYSSGETVILSSDNMLVNGSVTPQIFSILPLPSQKGDMVRVIITITSSQPQDFETFGSMPALTNGCVLRIKKQDGTFENVFNWKSNGEFIDRSFDSDFLVNTGNNVRAFFARRTFGGQSKNGVVIRLDGDLSEELQVVIQDDLVTGTTNTSFNMFAQGHAIQE